MTTKQIAIYADDIISQALTLAQDAQGIRINAMQGELPSEGDIEALAGSYNQIDEYISNIKALCEEATE